MTHHLDISEIEMEEMETGEREPLLKRDSSSSGVGGASASAISLETEVGGATAAAAAKAFGGGHPGDTINFGGLLPGMQASGGYIPHQVHQQGTLMLVSMGPRFKQEGSIKKHITVLYMKWQLIIPL